MATHIVLIIFLFALGACVGSFLNVVVWRLPRGESLITPPSHCPKCNTPLRWYDNIPVLGWILLLGRCRYCKQGISIRYPIVEAVSGGMFAFYYLAFFPWEWGMGGSWPVYVLYMGMLCMLLACSLIDAEHFFIPAGMLWVLAGVAMVVHGIYDGPERPGSVMTDTVGGALAAGAGVGLLLSIAAILFSWIPRSFAKGGPMLEVERMQLEQQVEQAKAQGQPPPETPVEYTPQQIRVEMNKEMIFLMPPMVLAGLWLVMCTRIFAVRDMWDIALGQAWMAGFLGSLLGALVGGFIVWLVRILGTLAFGREAMGMGDVHLMFAVGAVVGSGPVIVAFFLAPFFGIIVALYMLLVGKRREVPYGPYLSLATAFVLLAYHPIARYLRPGIEGMLFILQRIFAGLA